MHISDEHIAELQDLYYRNFGIRISTKEALDKGLRLVRLLEITLKNSLINTETSDDEIS